MKAVQIHKNRLGGEFFERCFVHRATLTGHWPIKQPLAYRFLRGGQKRAIRAELDFSLVDHNGRIAYVDCKVVSQKYFLKNRMAPFQMQRAYQYNLRRVPSGFVVHFTGCDTVSFYTGLQLSLADPKARYAPEDGMVLGRLPDFDPGLIYSADLGVSAAQSAQ